MKVELKGMRDKITGMERKQDRMKVRQDNFSSFHGDGIELICVLLAMTMDYLKHVIMIY
jgi:hypothetical protein